MEFSTFAAFGLLGGLHEELAHNIQLNRCVAINRSGDDGEEMLLGYMTCEAPKFIKDD